MEIAEIGALFHDIGKSIDKTASHGEIGAQICDDYLSSIRFDKNKCAQIVQIVHHKLIGMALSGPTKCESSY